MKKSNVLIMTLLMFGSSGMALATDFAIGCNRSYSSVLFKKGKNNRDFDVKADSLDEARRKAGEHIADIKNGKTKKSVSGNTYSCEGCDHPEVGCELVARVSRFEIDKKPGSRNEYTVRGTQPGGFNVDFTCTRCLLGACVLNSVDEEEAAVCTELANDDPLSLINQNSSEID